VPPLALTTKIAMNSISLRSAPHFYTLCPTHDLLLLRKWQADATRLAQQSRGGSYILLQTSDIRITNLIKTALFLSDND
jgi:hypothetical protein